ncbi:MAG: MarR family winged helix-turn-helix transcriptional regulator [Pseudomonadota bacterium]
MTFSHPCVCTTLRKASRAVTRAYDEGLADSGMTITQFAVLRNLDRQGAMPLSRLAELLVMDRTSLYRLIAPLERHGWVSVADGAGRAKLASITDAGRAAMLAATPAWEKVQDGLVGAMGAEAWAALQTQLRVLGSAAHADLKRTR